MADALLNLADYGRFVESFEPVALAVLAIFGGIVLAKLLGMSIVRLNKSLGGTGQKTAKSIARLVELFIFVVSLIVALNFLEVNAAKVILQNLIELTPSVIILLLLLLLGFIVVTLVVDIVKAALLRIRFDDYLHELGISQDIMNGVFSAIKALLFLVILSASLNYSQISVPFIDNILTGLIYGVIVLSTAVAFFAFREPFENFFKGMYVEKNLLKPGQTIRLGENIGEVVTVTNHGVLMRLPTGYDLMVPNREVMKQDIYIKRTKQDVGRLEAIRGNFIAQLPSHCGPASASMMLSFFGYTIVQDDLGRLAQTKTPGGTAPKKLIAAVHRLSKSAVKGALVKYDEIHNLRDELKTWLAEGALVILWFNKPALFKTKRGRGHYVLCVGIEGDEIIIMDPSRATAGVYLIDYRMFEEAMSEFDKKRGYLVFAKKGTSAFWRLSEGLIYSDITAYKELSKSFERYLKKLIRRNATINDLLSEHVFKAMGGDKKPQRVWKPENMDLDKEIKEGEAGSE